MRRSGAVKGCGRPVATWETLPEDGRKYQAPAEALWCAAPLLLRRFNHRAPCRDETPMPLIAGFCDCGAHLLCRVLGYNEAAGTVQFGDDLLREGFGVALRVTLDCGGDDA